MRIKVNMMIKGCQGDINPEVLDELLGKFYQDSAGFSPVYTEFDQKIDVYTIVLKAGSLDDVQKATVKFSAHVVDFLDCDRADFDLAEL